MNALKREMERKRKALQEAREKTSSDNSGFVRAADLRRVEEEHREEERNQKYQTLDKQDDKDDSAASSSNKKPRLQANGKDDKSNENVRKQQETFKEKTDNDSAASAKQPSKALDLKEITRQLRLLGLPVRLFGEQADQRQERLEKARKGHQQSLLGQSERQEFQLEKGHRIHNPFLQQSSQQINDSKNEESKAKAKKDPFEQYTEKDEKDPHIKILRYFRNLLIQWEKVLEERPPHVKQSVAGKNETNTVRQCRDYIQPLFRACHKKQLEPGMLQNLIKMVDFAKVGQFVKAHDAYMDLAIGRAAWPIGVTMVGIHARTGRAKIESNRQAHVMNSELHRKYLTSCVRLLKFAQTQATDVDPSQKVL